MKLHQDVVLNSTEQEQLYSYIDFHYASLGAIVNYVEAMATQTQTTARWNISFKQILNIIVSIIVTTALVAISAAIASFGNPDGVALGAIFGFASSVVSAGNNSCIKYCGTGYCNTSWNDCYTSSYQTSFLIKNN